MQHGRSRTRSREDSVKRRELEARRVPSLRPKQGEGPSTYQMQRPTGGREVLSPLPAPHARPPLGAGAAPATRAAARPTAAPAGPSGTRSSSSRPVVEPLYPVRPVIELDRRRSPRRASTQPGPFRALAPAPVPQPLRAQHTPAPRALPEESLAPSSIAPSRVTSASIRSEPMATQPAAPMAPPLARAPIAPSPPPVRSDPARHDATDLIPLRARSGAEPARRRLGWGWYIALAAAVAFFLATIALSAS